MTSRVKIKTDGYKSLCLEMHPTGIEFEDSSLGIESQANTHKQAI